MFGWLPLFIHCRIPARGWCHLQCVDLPSSVSLIKAISGNHSQRLILIQTIPPCVPQGLSLRWFHLRCLSRWQWIQTPLQKYKPFLKKWGAEWILFFGLNLSSPAFALEVAMASLAASFCMLKVPNFGCYHLNIQCSIQVHVGALQVVDLRKWWKIKEVDPAEGKVTGDATVLLQSLVRFLLPIYHKVKSFISWILLDHLQLHLGSKGMGPASQRLKL